MTIDAIACNPEIANAIRDVGADYLLAVKGNQPTLQADIEAAFKAAEAEDIEVAPDIDKGHGRIETRIVSVMRQGSMATAGFPENCASATPAPSSRSIRGQNSRTAAASTLATPLPPAHAPRPCEAEACRGHWGIQNTLHRTLDVTFQEDLARLRKGHGAHNMALVRNSPSTSSEPP